MPDYRRRVDALEQAINIANLEQNIEADLQAIWPELERLAADYDVTTDVAAELVRKGARRAAEIGRDAYDREMAAELGITVDQLRDRDFMREMRERERAEHRETNHAWEAKMHAQQVYWRAGVKYVGGVSVPG